MAYTESEAVVEVRSLINEESADFWSDTEITSWIRQGVIQISTKLLSAEKSEDLTLVASQWEYTSSDESWISDILKSKGVYYIDGSNNPYGLQRIDYNQIGHTMHFQREEAPKYYMESDRKFYVWPRPSATEAGNTVRVVHAAVTNDITLLRDEHQSMTFNYAAARAKMKDRQFQEAALYMAEFTNSINFERQDKYDMGVERTNESDVP